MCFYQLSTVGGGTIHHQQGSSMHLLPGGHNVKIRTSVWSKTVLTVISGQVASFANFIQPAVQHVQQARERRLRLVLLADLPAAPRKPLKESLFLPNVALDNVQTDVWGSMGQLLFQDARRGGPTPPGVSTFCAPTALTPPQPKGEVLP